MITAEKNEATTLAPPPRRAAQSVIVPVPPQREVDAPAARRAPMARKGLRPVRRARALGWRSPEAAAIVVASFCVSLACFYVAAYARVTAEGFESARVQGEMQRATAEREALEAEVSRLTLPATVKARAVQLEMIPTPPQTVRMFPAPKTSGDASPPQ